MYANANEPNFNSNVEPRRHTYSMPNLRDVFLSGGMVKQPPIAGKHKFEQHTSVNVDLEKILYAQPEQVLKVYIVHWLHNLRLTLMELH